MYKKVLYNIKKIRKCGGEGGGAIIEPKTLTMYLKKKTLRNTNFVFKKENQKYASANFP